MAELNVITHEDDIPTCTHTFYSLDEYADHADKVKDTIGRDEPSSFAGGSFNEAMAMARLGWADQLDAAIQVAESAVTMCEREHEIEVFMPVWDVQGSDVDVARYLAGEPENMIDYPLSKTSKVGRVITLCASIGYSAAIGAETIIKRGQVITALAYALAELGHSVELWADHSAGGRGRDQMRIRTLIKGANDTLDPARVMFAYAHPTMLRQLGFAIKNATPESVSTVRTWNSAPIAPLENLPEGTLYLPSVRSNRDIPDAHEVLKGYLGELGLLAE